MQRLNLLSSSTNNLVVNNNIVANSIEVTDLNVTNDVFINNSLFTPVGSILTYAGVNAPSGWLLCDGSEVSRESYPRLYDVIGSLYGNPVNNANFVLPNLADRVPVGKSGSTSVGNSGGNSSITLTTNQLPSHTHTGTTDLSGSHIHTGTTDSNGSHTHTVNDPGHAHSQTTVNDDYNSSGGSGYPSGSNPSFAGYDSAGSKTWNNINTGYTGISLNSADNHTHTFTSGSAGSHTHTFTTSSTGSSASIDIRNKFVVINYIIRY